METTLYKITFKDGREFRVFCANKKQKQRFHRSIIDTKTEVSEITNGIHNITQWEKIINNITN